MNYTVIGKEFVNYTSKRTGHDVRAYNIYLTYYSKKIDGLGCINIFVDESVGTDINLSDEVNLYFNEYKRVVKIEKSETF